MKNESNANWLLYVHTNLKEESHERKSLKLLLKHLSKGVSVYLIHFGPSTLSNAYLTCYTSNSITRLLTVKNKSIDDVPTNLKFFSDYLLRQSIEIDALCIVCHGASYGLGKWKTWDRPFLQINDAVRYLMKPFKIRLVLFDSCFQGNMSCLYELPKEVEVTIASPAFHPFVSILWTKAFGKLKRNMTRRDLLSYGHLITCEWNDLTRAKWKCLLVFDMKYIPMIARSVESGYDLLKFDRVSQIDKEDANLHDLFAAARFFPSLQSLIIKSTASTCKKCLDVCTKRVRGMSMEAHLPRKWITAYSSTKWYKEIVSGKRGFEKEKLDTMFSQGKI